MAATSFERVVDKRSGQAKADADGQPIYVIHAVILNGSDSVVLAIKVAGAPTPVTEGEMLAVTGLTFSPWEVDGRNGITYRAERVESVTAAAKSTSTKSAA